MLFGPPGNPMAVMVTFFSAGAPALLRMMGCITPTPPAAACAQPGDTAQKNPAALSTSAASSALAPTASLGRCTTGNQARGFLSSMVQANGLIVLHHDQGNVAAGDMVDVMMFEVRSEGCKRLKPRVELCAAPMRRPRLKTKARPTNPSSLDSSKNQTVAKHPAQAEALPSSNGRQRYCQTEWQKYQQRNAGDPEIHQARGVSGERLPARTR